MPELDVLAVLNVLASLLVAFGLGTIIGFLLGARIVIRLVTELLPLGKGLFGGHKMGMWDLAGMLLKGNVGKINLGGQGGLLGGLLGGK